MLEVKELETVFAASEGVVRAVRSVSFSLRAGETLGLVGESGCGKSTTALSVVGLLPPNARIVAGSIRFDGMELTNARERMLRRVRGRQIGMIFQDSMASLNPLLTVGRQIEESLEYHLGLSRSKSRMRAAELLAEVGVPDPRRRLQQLPHQLSGGLRQRVAIAIALAPEPELVIADEPTTALDVTIQAQLLELLQRLLHQRTLALIVITHDLSVVARICDRVAIMYAGRIVEEGSTDEIFSDPRHPYTIGLLKSVPRFGAAVRSRLEAVGGAPPALWNLAPGCPFQPRCSFALEGCTADEPELAPVAGGTGHRAACWADLRSGQ